ncbi:MAG: oxaloacetate decarboxylase subunit alpha [Clostridiales bacterium]|jgi:oxaloacetate decarboxylase alpha subunit|nr:oxaloacetate decarboxylase subunit alpha [Clostridiales bacterium]
MSANKVGFMDTTLRDGQQSLIATRMKFEDMQPILDVMDNAGFHSIECWGGATFDSAMRFLKEDPWERLRSFRKAFKKTKLQMLFRGQNILGYRCYPDDAVEAFIRKTIENGIDILRIFDALNDLRNIESSVKAVKAGKAHAQLCMCYTLSEIHTTEYFVKLAKSLADMGADSICVKDMAGLLTPAAAFKLVKGIKAAVKVPLAIHSHYTSGMAAMTYLKSVEAGADIIDTASSPFAMGTSQPATEVMAEALRELGYDTGLDMDSLVKIAEYFRPQREKALQSGLLSAKVLAVDVEMLKYQVPGGMLSNLVSQLKEQKAEHRYGEVLAEIPRVRADLGYPPLVTPSSQIVGVQAVMNVLAGEQYKVVTKETKDLVRGMYGQTPGPISEEVRKKIIGDEKPITVSPASLLQPVLKESAQKISEYMEQEEDALSYALFPQVAMDFFKFRHTKKSGVDLGFAGNEEPVYPA